MPRDDLADLLAEAGASDPERALAAIAELRGRLDAIEAARVREAVVGGASWARIGRALGVSRQAAHRRHAGRVRQGALAEGRQHVITRRARQAVELARLEARALRSPEVRPEHLLLGLLRDDRGAAVDALAELGVALPRARRAVEEAYDAGELKPPERVARAPAGRLPVSDAARLTFEQALRESVALGHVHLGVEHLLLALLRADAAPALLRRLGAPVEDVEREVLALVTGR